jgi:hypothetical protein
VIQHDFSEVLMERGVLFSASLVESSVTQRLKADVSSTQQMDQHLIGLLADDASDTGSHTSTDSCPPHIQVHI